MNSLFARIAIYVFSAAMIVAGVLSNGPRLFDIFESPLLSARLRSGATPDVLYGGATPVVRPATPPVRFLDLTAIPHTVPNLTADGSSSVKFHIRVTSSTGYSGPVSFSLSGAPGGLVYRFSPGSVHLSRGEAQTVVLTMRAKPATWPGTYWLETGAFARGRLAGETGDVTVAICPPRANAPYTLATSEPETDGIPSGTASTTVSVTLPTGYSSMISLKLKDDPVTPILGAPGGRDAHKIYASFGNARFADGGTSKLLFAIRPSVPCRDYHFLVTGSSSLDGARQETPFTLSVIPNPVANVTPYPDYNPTVYTGDRPSYPLAKSPADMIRIDAPMRWPASPIRTRSAPSPKRTR